MNLKLLRQNAGLTQKKMSEICQITLRSYQNYESQQREMGYKTLIKIADYFGCSIDYLLEHETKGILHLDSFTPAQQKLVEMIKQLNPDQALFLTGYISEMLKLPFESVKPVRPW